MWFGNELYKCCTPRNRREKKRNRQTKQIDPKLNSFLFPTLFLYSSSLLIREAFLRECQSLRKVTSGFFRKFFSYCPLVMGRGKIGRWSLTGKYLTVKWTTQWCASVWGSIWLAVCFIEVTEKHFGKTPLLKKKCSVNQKKTYLTVWLGKNWNSLW